ETLRYKWARPEVQRKGACVFVLDQFIQHDDRRRENPNLLWYQRELVAIDHGHAFTGIHNSGATGAALAGRTVLLAPRAFEDHILRAALAKLGCVEEVRKAARRLHKVQTTDIDRLAAA